MSFLEATVPRKQRDMIPAARVPHSKFLKDTRGENRFFTPGKTGGRVISLK